MSVSVGSDGKNLRTCIGSGRMIKLRHVRNFDRNELSALCEKCGRIVSVAVYNKLPPGTVAFWSHNVDKE